MRAGIDDQRQLLELQELDTALGRLAHRKRVLPEYEEKQSLEAEGETLDQRWLAARGALEDVSLELSRAESEVGLVEQRIERNAKRATESSGARDAQSLESEQKSLKARLAELEDIQLAIMEQHEATSTAVAELETERVAYREALDGVGARIEDALASIANDAKELNTKRAELAARLPQELVELYEKQRARYGIGAARLRGGVSLGSNVALPPSELERFMKADPQEVLIEQDSGCILVRLPEDAAPEG